MGADTSSVLHALGLTPDSERLYFALAPASGQTLDEVARFVRGERESVLRALEPLRELGIVRLVDDRVVVPLLAEAVAELVQREARLAATSAERLDSLALALPHLVAASTRPAEQDLAEVRPLDGELSTGGDPLELLSQMIRSTRGDMLWLRPDPWSLPREAAVTAVLAEAMATGRRSRAIYPVRALTEAPEVLQARARIGEQVRVLAELPTRMFILGQAHAVLPEPLGTADEPRIHVRQRALVTVLMMWFESLWSRAAPVPQLEAGEARPDLRRFLLEQLVKGYTDELIARRLGISLRTVRRRIASLMEDLGVDTRFQAGVEAARRGWI